MYARNLTAESLLDARCINIILMKDSDNKIMKSGAFSVCDNYAHAEFSADYTRVAL